MVKHSLKLDLLLKSWVEIELTFLACMGVLHLYCIMCNVWLDRSKRTFYFLFLDHGKENSVQLNNMSGDGVLQAMEKLITSGAS